jgi:hypothetical protein
MTIKDFMQLELRLIARNIRPKVLFSFGALILLALFFSPPEPKDSSFSLLMFSLLLTGSFSIYAQLWIAWDGSYFCLLMTSPNAVKSYIEAKFYLSFIYVLCLTLASLYYAFVTHLMGYLIPMFFYNAGINTYLMLFFSFYNIEKSNLWKDEILFEGIVPMQYVTSVLFYCLPLLLYFGFNHYFTNQIALWVIGGAGFISLILHRLILNFLVQKFVRRKKILLESYNTQ